MYCIDSSIIASFVVKEEGWEKLIEYLSKGITIDLAFKETLNMIWKRKVLLKEDINLEKALYKINELRKILTTVDQRKLYDKALEISIKHKVPIYDSLFIALALEEDLTLVTKDKKQYEVAKEEKVNVILV